MFGLLIDVSLWLLLSLADLSGLRTWLATPALQMCKPKCILYGMSLGSQRDCPRLGVLLPLGILSVSVCGRPSGTFHTVIPVSSHSALARKCKEDCLHPPRPQMAASVLSSSG